MNRTVAVLLVLCAGANCAKEGKPDATGLATHYGCLDNRVSSDSLLFKSSAISTTECGGRCLGHTGCVAFTAVAPSGLCRGHSSLPRRENSFSTSLGAQTWTFQHGVSCPNPCFQLVAPGTCLKLYLAEKSHSEASNHCQQEGGRLYTIKTPERKDLLKTFISDQGLGTTSVWLDAVKAVQGGDWVWGDGDILPLNSSLWYPNQPNSTGARCLKTWGDYLLDDYYCGAGFKHVCEMSVP